jgi:hypothetical protein
MLVVFFFFNIKVILRPLTKLIKKRKFLIINSGQSVKILETLKNLPYSWLFLMQRRVMLNSKLLFNINIFIKASRFLSSNIKVVVKPSTKLN